LPKEPARLPLYDRSLKVIHPNRSSPIKSAAILLTFPLTASLSQAAVIGSWTRDETSGDILDATGNHPEGMATGTPTDSTAGVPNGSSGSSAATNAAGTSIDYGPIFPQWPSTGQITVWQ
jgi:hypothetical protein